MEIKYTKRAVSHLNMIQKYLFEHAPEYAEIVIDRLFAKIHSLKRMPQRGLRIPEWLTEEDETREIYFHPYLISYLVENDSITILSILHHRQKRKRYKNRDE